MDKININVKYLESLSKAEEELLNHFKGEWISQDDSLSVNIRILFAEPSDLEDIYDIKTISTTDNELTLSQTSTQDFVVCLKKKDLQHISYEVMDIVHQCRKAGYPCYFTMDAGPNVKVLVQKKDQQAVIDKLTSYFDPEQIIASNIGTGVEILNEEDAL